MTKLQWAEAVKMQRIDSPGPCLLRLKQEGDGRVVEAREEDEIDDISDVFINTHARSRTKLGK